MGGVGRLAAVAELTTRRREEFLDPVVAEVKASNPDEVDAFISSEIAAALRMSRVAARDRMDLAEALRDRLPGTARALREGRIHLAHVRRIEEVTAVLTDVAAASVEDRVLPRAAAHDSTQTPSQVAAACRRAAAAADPEANRNRCEAARRARRVTSWALPDGMACLKVIGSAEVVAAAWSRVDAVARLSHEQARSQHGTGHDTTGDPLPTLDELRADTVLGLLAGSSDLMADAAGVQVNLDLLAPLGTALGVSDESGHLDGYGPLPAVVVRALAGDARWRSLTTDDSGTVTEVGRHTYRPTAALADAIRARDVSCRFPGCRRRAPACDLDHTVPFLSGCTEPDNLAALCRHHHRLKHRAGWTLTQRGVGQLEWTSPTGDVYTTEPHRWEERRPRGPDARTDTDTTGDSTTGDAV